MSHMNRLANATNPYQGEYKRVLAVCSAGLLRSPTTAFVLSQEPFNFNTRAAGVSDEYALIVVDDVLIAWADEVVCMAEEHRTELLAKGCPDEKITVLGIPDDFKYRDSVLQNMIKERYAERHGITL